MKPEEISAMLYHPRSSEWPEVDRDAECDRLVQGLDKILELSVAEHFSVPVDINSFPLYAFIIAYPIDLSLIKARLENRFYRCVGRKAAFWK